MRSGWNSSKSSSFSPVDAKTIGPADDLLDRQGGAAAGVAVELGEDDAVERQGVVEGRGGRHRVLAGHRVDDEERVVGSTAPAMCRTSSISVVVDRQPAGGVDDDDVAPEALGLGERRRGDRHRVGRLAEDGDADLAAEHAELLDGGRALQVGADEQRVAALLLEPAGELGRGGRLAGALQPGEQHDRRRLRPHR